MKKFLILLLLILTASILGGLYGVIHDQITYTISDEYYTKFKFIQFGIDSWGLGNNVGTDLQPEIILRNPRFGVGIVGVLATWWVGLFIGIILSFVGLIHRNASQMFRVTIKSLALTLLIALAVGCMGLLYGHFVLIDNIPNWHYPGNLIDMDHFIMVGSMHNFSYLGGLIGLAAAIVYSIRKAKRQNKVLAR